MTNAQMLTMFQNMVDDEIDQTFAYQLLDLAKTEVEAMRDWEQTKEIDSTQTLSSGDTWETAHTLPSDFSYMHAVYLATDEVPLQQISYEKSRLFKDSTNKFYS